MTKEKEVKVLSGWTMLMVLLGLFVIMVFTFLKLISRPTGWEAGLFFLSLLAFIFVAFGFFTLQPNEAKVLVLFGKYKGTVKEDGFHCGPILSSWLNRDPIILFLSESGTSRWRS